MRRAAQRDANRARDIIEASILHRHPSGEPVLMEREKLAEAIANEDYEEAARLRDSLQNREDRSEPS